VVGAVLVGARLGGGGRGERGAGAEREDQGADVAAAAMGLHGDLLSAVGRVDGEEAAPWR
jgi:hypothetical protein